MVLASQVGDILRFVDLLIKCIFSPGLIYYWCQPYYSRWQWIKRISNAVTTGSPSSSCEMIILGNKSYSENLSLLLKRSHFSEFSFSRFPSSKSSKHWWMSNSKRNFLPTGNSTWTDRTLQVFDFVYYFYFSVVLKSLSMPLLILFIYFPFSYYLVILFIFSFLFSSYAPVILQIFPTPFRSLILSPLTMKKEVVCCCFCCRFRCCANK